MVLDENMLSGDIREGGEGAVECPYDDCEN